MPDAEVMRPTWGPELTDRLKTLSANSQEAAPIIQHSTRFPLVVFLPGGSQKVLSYTALLEDVASHGYVVAAIEPAYNAPAMQLSDGSVLTKLPFADRSWEEPKTLSAWLRNHQQMVLQWAGDVRFVLDQLNILGQSDRTLRGRLDLDRVGALGHSFGGFAAGTSRLVDQRVQCAINLDGNETGTAFDYATDVKDAGVQPLLWIEAPYEPPTEAGLKAGGLSKEQWADMYADGDRQMSNVRDGALRVTITRVGIDHLDFSDQPFWSASLSPEARAGKLRTLRITRAYTLGFCDGCLKGQWASLRELVAEAGDAWPEVSVRRFGPLLRR
jgi:predicted dienelactone hydrolase